MAISHYCSALLAAAWLVIGGAGARAQQVEPRRGQVEYNIPSQNLSAALKAYADISGVQLLYETSITTGARSAPLKGTFEPMAALRLLLAGSGLVARRTDFDAITIAPGPPDEAVASRPPVNSETQFLGALQSGIRNALCQSDATRPGAYRIAVQLWITLDGAVQHVALLGSTGDLNRDRVLAGALQNVTVGEPPPATMQQPLTMVIVPRVVSAGGECGRR